MSKDIIILTPNGRRIKVQCTPDTNILQVLEDVCVRQGFQSEQYELKHHNKVLDLTTTVRFCNLPNKATLEMVETDKRRVESNVVIGLHLEDGERKTGDFPSKTTLFDLLSLLAPNELTVLKNPTIMYMRQEVTGIPALKQKTLRQLGLLSGRAILRLLDKAEESVQANISCVYRRQSEKLNEDRNLLSECENSNNHANPGPSQLNTNIDCYKLDPVKFINTEATPGKKKTIPLKKEQESVDKTEITSVEDTSKMEICEYFPTEKLDPNQDANNMGNSQANLERRLRIEEEVTFLGPQKAIAFMHPDGVEEEGIDLPDDFYDLTIEEVRKIYHELQQRRIELENTPLITANKREELDIQTSQQMMKMYKNAVVRIQFPDNIILQGVFTPTNTIADITSFVKDYLKYPEKSFRIFTTPLKESLDPQTTLLAAKFVPCVHMHFKWQEENSKQQYLKDEVYEHRTSSDAASILASKYRAPSRRKQNNSCDETQNTEASSSKQSKVPKWFK